jgi:hypothetical protein
MKMQRITSFLDILENALSSPRKLQNSTSQEEITNKLDGNLSLEEK